MASDAKHFEGRSIDEAIDQACKHFDVDREALEVEILNDASGGIFGLVGGRKATVRAMLRDQSVELKLYVRDVLIKLIEPIAGHPSLEVSMEGPGKVLAVIDDEEQAGLLIGKEGVTLQALQYIANRILAKQWPEQVRLRLDAGDYRERQNESLREMALGLAEKAIAQNRSQSTRPLASYHRRVVHMALQDDAAVQTRSKGDGPMKRVIIQPAKSNGTDAGNGNGSKPEKTAQSEKAAKSGNGSKPGKSSKPGNGSKPGKAAKPPKNGNVAEAALETDDAVAADAANDAPAKEGSGKNGRSRSRGSRGGRSRSGRGRGRSRKPAATESTEQSPTESAPEQPVAADAPAEPAPMEAPSAPSPTATAPELSAEFVAPKQPEAPEPPVEPEAPKQSVAPEPPVEPKAPKQPEAPAPSNGQSDAE